MTDFLRWLGFLFRHTAQAYRSFRVRQAWMRKGVTIDPTVNLYQDKAASLILGEQTTIAPYTLIHLQMDPNTSIPMECKLTIGRHTAINEFCNLRASGGSITIGDNCLIAQFVSIIASNHGQDRDKPIRVQPWDTTKHSVTIGDDVWIGAHAVVLPGVTIGRGSIIGAGSVVTVDIPEFCIAAGVPARVIGERR